MALIVASWKLIIGLGASGIAAYTICVYEAVRMTSAVNAALVLATLPMMIVLASWLINRDRITRTQLLGMAISFGGAVVIVAHGSLAVLLALRFNIGDLWMLAAVPLWAIYAVLQRRRPAGNLTPHAGDGEYCRRPAAPHPRLRVGGRSWGIYAVEHRHHLRGGYTAVLASAVSYVLWNRGPPRLAPTAPESIST